jgi:hypothetical protein
MWKLAISEDAIQRMAIRELSLAVTRDFKKNSAKLIFAHFYTKMDVAICSENGERVMPAQNGYRYAFPKWRYIYTLR